MAMQSQDPNIVTKVGRWKTLPVFYDRYVHTKTPADFSQNILFS